MRCSQCHNHYNSIIQDTIISEGIKYNVHICPRCDNIDYVPVIKKSKRYQVCEAI